MIKGSNIILERAGEAESELLFKWRSKPEIYKNFANQDEITLDHHKNWFSKNAHNYYFVIKTLEGEPLGLTLLENIDHRNRRCFWGIYIAETIHRGKGFAQEATKLVLNFGFDYLNLHKIYGTTLAGNVTGRKFHKSVGFKEEAVLKDYCFFDGEYHDLIYISTTKIDL